MNFIDLGRQYKRIEADVNSRISKILSTQSFIMGNEVSELEERLAEYCGRRYCLCCGSGTEALQIPLMGYGLKPTDAVFVPSFTFFSSAESVNLANATPVFVEVDEDFNIDPIDLKKKIDQVLEEGKLTPKGVIAVDLFGRSADYDSLLAIAERYGLFLLEDAAQGFGGSLNGKMNCSFGDVSATSFFPAKPLGCYGDGGAVFTDDKQMFELMKSIRVHGQGEDKYDNERIGINGRMDTIQAAVVLSKLEIFDSELRARQDIAKKYADRLGEVIETPRIDDNHVSAWAQFTLKAKNESEREAIRAHLASKGIPTMVYYPIPLHRQKAYADSGVAYTSLPFTEALCKKVFSIPMHPYLTESEIETVCDAVEEAVSG